MWQLLWSFDMANIDIALTVLTITPPVWISVCAIGYVTGHLHARCYHDQTLFDIFPSICLYVHHLNICIQTDSSFGAVHLKSMFTLGSYFG